MDGLLLYYGAGVTIAGIVVTFYAINVFLKEREKWAELRGTMKCFVLAAACFTIAGLFMGANYTSLSDHAMLRMVPQFFYLSGFVFFLLGARNFRKFSAAAQKEKG